MGKIDPKIIEKIRKLIALGTDNENENEGGAALRKAAALAEEHGLALSDVNPETGKVDSVGRNDIRLRNKSETWVIHLAQMVTNAFECELIMVNYKGRGDASLSFLGTPTDLDMAIWFFKMIKIKIKRQSEAKYTRTKDRQTYANGAIFSLHKRLHTMFVQPREELRSQQTRDLVVVKKEDIKEKVAEEFGEVRTTKLRPQNMTNRAAYEDGKIDGKNMPLYRGELEKTA